MELGHADVAGEKLMLICRLNLVEVVRWVGCRLSRRPWALWIFWRVAFVSVFFLSAWLDRWILFPSRDRAASSIGAVSSNILCHDLLWYYGIGYRRKTRDNSRKVAMELYISSTCVTRSYSHLCWGNRGATRLPQWVNLADTVIAHYSSCFLFLFDRVPAWCLIILKLSRISPLSDIRLEWYARYQRRVILHHIRYPFSVWQVVNRS